MTTNQTSGAVADPLVVIDSCKEAQSRGEGSRVLLQRLATAYEAAGEWTAACDVLRTLVAYGDSSPTTHRRLARCLARTGLVPFELSRGQPVIRPVDEEALSQALVHLKAAMAQQGKRVTPLHRLAGRMARRRWLFELAMRTPALATRINRRVVGPSDRLKRLIGLGRLHEARGDLTAAADSYRSALARLETVDAIWVHKAEAAWRFSLAHVEQRLHPSPDTDERLHRSVAPASDDPSPLDGPTRPPGFFEGRMTEAGLLISGFLVPGQPEVVNIAADGAPLTAVRANTRTWLPTFRLEISHAVLAHLPERVRLSVTSADQALVTIKGAHELDVEIPGGSGQLTRLLATGYGISKKGSLTRPAADREKRQRRYLDAYDEAKDSFDRLLGSQLFLSYGTLLGCYRDGTFIAGDDDFDVAYVSAANDPVALKRETQQTALTLLGAGYDVGITVSGRLFKIRVRDVWLDVNPFWFYRGRAWAFDTHNLDRADIEPLKTMQFLQHEVYVPNDVEAFLKDNYGSDWRRPQPDFRYFRSEADRRILRRSWLTPSEARAFARAAADERDQNRLVGRFVGIVPPADTGFG